MHKIQARLLIFILDAVALILAFVVSGLCSRYVSHYFAGNPYIDIYSEKVLERTLHFSAMSIMALFIFYNRGHYLRRIPWWSQVRYVAMVLVAMLFIEVFIHFSVKHQISRIWLVSSWFCALFFILIGRALSKNIANKLQVWQIETTLIGDSENIIETIFALYSEKHTGYNIKSLVIFKGYQNFNKDDLPAIYKDIDIIDGKQLCEDFIRNNTGSFFVLTPDSFENFDVERVVELIKSQESNYAIVPPIEGIELYGTPPQYFFGSNVMFLLSRQNIDSPMARLVKRAVDIFGSLFGIIILSPVFILAAFLVKKEDGGPVLFNHYRVGKNGKLFKCLKFRSMNINSKKLLDDLLRNDEEARKYWDLNQKLINDPRITKIGNFLRKSSLDELPQLLNVLKGEMSLVGPRPIIEDEMKHYKNKISSYLLVKPGVTGLWQVAGRSDTSYKHRVYLDVWYVKNWSLWHDVVILIKTIFVVMARVGAR